MSAWDFDRPGGAREQFGWDEEPEWNFDSLEGQHEDDWDGHELFASFPDFDDHFDHDPPSTTHSSFTHTTRTAAPPSQPRHEHNSRSHDTAFLDNILHATAPARNRPQAPVSTQGASSQRQSAEQSRQASHSALPASSSRQIFANNNHPHAHQHHFGYIPSALFDESDNENRTPPSTQQSSRLSDRASEEFATLEDDTDEEEGVAAMAPGRRRTAQRDPATVDLTSGTSRSDAPSQRSGVRKRSIDSSEAGEARASKRSRIVQGDIEEIDLTNGAPSAEEELRQQQQRDAIKLQQAAEESCGPHRIGKRTCIICMENFTNCTIASCGHFYCHECLIQALIAGEKNSDRGHGTCPQCRKPLTRNNKKKRDIIPLSFMKKETFEKNRQKRLQAL